MSAPIASTAPKRPLRADGIVCLVEQGVRRADAEREQLAGAIRPFASGRAAAALA